MKILVADDHNLFVDALSHLLEGYDGVARVDKSSDYASTVRSLADHKDTNVLLLDLRMPGLELPGGIQSIYEQFPDCKIIALSGTASRSEIETATSNGAVGFISKSILGHEVFRAVQTICSTSRGEEPKSFGIGEHDRQGNIRFTEREKEILSYLQRGMTNKEMAKELHISPETVKIYVKSIGDKLGSRNRTDLIVRALEIGAVQPSLYAAGRSESGRRKSE